MDQSFSVENFTVKTDNHNIRVSQAFIYILEINRDLEDTTGVDLISAATAGVDSYGSGGCCWCPNHNCCRPAHCNHICWSRSINCH